MKSMVLSAAASIGLAIGLASCSTTAEPLEPIPGSITYGGQPHTKLTKSPIGSHSEAPLSLPRGNGRRDLCHPAGSLAETHPP